MNQLRLTKSFFRFISGLNLMNFAAIKVMQSFNDIVLAFGQSDEYSFVFHKSTAVYNRRASKILTCVNSMFTSSYVFYWSQWFPEKPLLYPPSFDGRIVAYPSNENIRDYLSWRQADTHINNLYNTIFWKLVLEGGRTNTEAEADLCGTLSADKNELLFSKFGTNYNNLPELYRKGTTLVRKQVLITQLGEKRYQLVVPLHTDIIKDQFWIDHPEILENDKPQHFELGDLLESTLIQMQLKKKTT